MKIQFNIQTVGYIVAELETEDEKIKIGHSYAYGDKFQELLNGLFFVYSCRREANGDIFPYSFEIMWYDDRVNYSWIITADSLQSELEIRIIELSPTSSIYSRELWKKNLSFDNLFNEIYSSLDRLLLEFGFIGYKNNWEVGNFPLGEYLMLKADKFHFNLELMNIDEEEWKNKVPIKRELDLVLFDQH
ncbi:hypothetical protein GO495_07420 [Chitinophaga oryziterrae]|uniref:Uncharacterized protein n=1 Tax=Chitinophaga oryziterrae TaxID=1031224 RepID=A0A6N8J5A2_9BACT|nr:hypothetical protein [Chitinophaga oryziterrae]MVT40407.1 hypothetical protein [Chitinophaga oryziterrae]